MKPGKPGMKFVYRSQSTIKNMISFVQVLKPKNSKPNLPQKNPKHLAEVDELLIPARLFLGSRLRL